jgi:hypothetical protein
LADIIPKVLNKPYAYGRHYGPHDLESTDVGTGKTRMEQARKLGLNFTVVPDVSIEDGINATSLWLSRLDVDKEKCKKWLKSMKAYCREWDEKRGMFKDEPLHNWASHGADEGRYAALVADRMRNDIINVHNRPFHDQTLKIWRNE